jgi:hypothetical protein
MIVAGARLTEKGSSLSADVASDGRTLEFDAPSEWRARALLLDRHGLKIAGLSSGYESLRTRM